jgi:D-arabinose 1-dehydrogenase-like Zn-dependent alcohol dehydrogenase
MAEMFSLVEHQKIKPLINDIVPLQDTKSALERMENKMAIGKTLIRFS